MGDDNNSSKTSANKKERVRRSRLIINGVAGLLGLTWKMVMLPITITGASVGLITGVIGLGFWVAGGVLSYSLSIIGVISPGRNRESSLIQPAVARAPEAIENRFGKSERNQASSAIPPVSVSEAASGASGAIDLSSEFESWNGKSGGTRESSPIPPVSVSEDAAGPSEATDFLSDFEILYGKRHPNFVPDGFTEAVQRSRREFKLLFVYLHSPEHPDTPEFCSVTLCSEIISAFINENFVSWGDSINANGGHKMSRSLKASRFPFWAVIMAAAGQKLQSVLEESTPAFVAARLDTEEHRNNTRLSEEQDAVFEADQAKDHQQREGENQLEREAAFAKSLGPEPEKGPDVTQVLVRLPNGERKGRRFHCTTTLQSLYDFVDSSGCLEVGSYNLVTFFPRVVYGSDELSSTLEELGLYPRASLFVELNM
ncbi:Thioredoxin-like fold [Cynara cardunculus var. scolymus]|uniref:Thioredoxin-like fold n=1 Tax=Cynara cardunculus var. scolymus TaxID=59895 RepID=A0A103XQZ1_CYNCS|nr:Thioredoxin-like fold [Cynara cardunculus var. scolymus]